MASVNTQFSIAIHLMASLGCQSNAPSGHLAESINASPSFVRRILAKLSKAGLVETTMGKAGACALARNPKDITLLEIYEAVEAPKVFAIHEYPAQRACSVSCRIKDVMENVLDEAQGSMEKALEKLTLKDVIADLKKG